MIELRNLTKKFPSVIAVNNLTLDIKPGINGLIGENGAGKSTLLRLIADVYTKDEGSILIDGKDNHEDIVKGNLFFLSDNPYFASNANVKETLSLYSSLFDLDEEKFYQLLDKLSLPKDRKISTFSKGMRRQLFLAIALSMKADYILLDEAFDGLDPIVQDIVKQEIIMSSSSKTFLISSHNLSSLERLCDNFILLSKGKFAKGGQSEDLGRNFKKYQIMFDEEVDLEKLKNDGINAISFKKIGSISYVVVDGLEEENKIKNKYKNTLFEPVPIDNEEIIMLEMIVSKGGNE